MKLESLAVAFAIGVSGAAFAADQTPMSLDSNKDGSLSKEELKGNDLSSSFDKMDSNQDGMLSQAEIDLSATTKGDATMKAKDMTKAAH